MSKQVIIQRKPDQFDAIQWTGYNFQEVSEFLKDRYAGYIKAGEQAVILIEDNGGELAARKKEWIVRVSIGNYKVYTEHSFNHLFAVAASGKEDVG